MRIVAITDYTFPSLDIEEQVLRPEGFELRAGQCKTPDTLIPLVRDADAVITQFAPINAEVIGAMERARVIVRYGIGVDNVDLVAAQQRNIPVCNVPDYCIDEVADHTLAMLLSITRQVVTNTLHLRAGLWGLATPLTGMRALRGQTVGIVGFGRIGRQVAQRLLPFGCRLLVNDPGVHADEIRTFGCDPTSLNDLLINSDIVTLHCPSTMHTRCLINEHSLRQMKSGAIIINVARGDLIDTAALVAALDSGHIGAAALDVCDPEPIPLTSPLRSLPNVIVSAHIASASVHAVRTLRETAVQLALTALRGESLRNVVNGVS